jgi:hypothetical protein
VRHKFPPNFVLPAIGVTVVYDQGMHASTPGAVDSSSGSLGLVNGGATVTLKDASGATADSFTYGASVEGVAKNRNPDVTAGAAITDHGSVPGAVGALSPGLRADGTPFLGFGSVGAPPAAPPAVHDLLVTQFATRGLLTSTDDFVEVYNATGHTVDASGVRLQAEAASCLGWYNRHVVPSGVVLAPGQFYLVGGAGYVAPGSGPPPNATLSSGLPDSGLLRLIDATGIELDRVAYGTGLACSGEGNTVAPNHGTTANGNSVARKPGTYSMSTPAQDTDSNAADFVVKTGRAPHDLASAPQRSR